MLYRTAAFPIASGTVFAAFVAGNPVVAGCILIGGIAIGGATMAILWRREC